MNLRKFKKLFYMLIIIKIGLEYAFHSNLMFNIL